MLQVVEIIKQLLKRSIIFQAFSLILILSSVLLFSCTEIRKNFPKEKTPASYEYPHAKNWQQGHIVYYSKFDKEIQHTSKDCAQCHQLENAQLVSSGANSVLTKHAIPLNVKESCWACHPPTSTEARENANQPPPDFKPVKNECAECHVEKFFPTGLKYSHYPSFSGLCSSCHTADPKHMTELDKKYVVTNKKGENCYTCHFRKDADQTGKPQKHIHGLLATNDESCIKCHDPHASDQRYFIKEKTIADSCLSCHNEKGGSSKYKINPDGKSVHAVIKTDKGCVNCHNPHSSPNDKNLQKEYEKTQELCFSCHDKDIKTADGKRTIPNIKKKIKEDPFPHSVFTENNCSVCHDPHSSKDNDRLLTDTYSLENQNDFSKNPYSLCMTCHGDHEFENKYTKETNFRHDFENEEKFKTKEGKEVTVKREKKNLHWFHVVDATGNTDKSAGVACRVCHDPHGGVQPFHINTLFTYQNFQNATLQFTKKDKGGECMACHEPRSYQRE